VIGLNLLRDATRLGQPRDGGSAKIVEGPILDASLLGDVFPRLAGFVGLPRQPAWCRQGLAVNDLGPSSDFDEAIAGKIGVSAWCY
jgi:hypothetical protein